MQVAYLSEAWLAAIDEALAARDHLAGTAAATAPGLGLTQVVTGDDAGAAVTYHVTSHGGRVTVGWGPAAPEDVRIEGPRATVAAIAAGRRNAAEAFIRGEVTVTGRPDRLLGASELLRALDDVMAAVAPRTRFDDA